MLREAAEVLVTGGTGLIGGELVATLLSRNWRVHAIVRAKGGKRPPERLSERLMKSSWQWKANAHNLAVVSGDVTKDNLGLPPRSSEGVSAIVHCAGETSFKDADLCWKTNLNTAKHIVAFAHRMAVPPTVIFVSTAFVCMSPPHSVISENACYDGYANGYIKSKREAELVFLRSRLNVVIVRPSIVLSADIEDRRMARSVLWAVPLLVNMKEIFVDGSARLDIVPVQYVADAIEHLLAKRRLSHRCYNISSSERQAVTCSEIVDDIWHRGYCKTQPRFAGAREDTVSRSGFSSHKTATASLNYYLPFLNADVVYSNERLIQELETDCPRCPRATQYMHKLLAQIGFAEAARESFNP